MMVDLHNDKSTISNPREMRSTRVLAIRFYLGFIIVGMIEDVRSTIQRVLSENLVGVMVKSWRCMIQSGSTMTLHGPHVQRKISIFCHFFYFLRFLRRGQNCGRRMVPGGNMLETEIFLGLAHFHGFGPVYAHPHD